MHVLLLNPNTRADLTDELVALVAPSFQDTGVAVRGATAPFGADYIASEQTYLIAAHAVLDAWHAHVQQHGRPLAVLVACFGDPGVWALREVAGVPVMGLAEAAMREAEAIGPFAIVTGGASWGPMLERLARGLRLHGEQTPRGLMAVHTVAASGGALRAAPDQALAELSSACVDVVAAQAHRARSLDAVILGGAALGGWARRLAPVPSVPVIDSVEAGARWLRRVAVA